MAKTFKQFMESSMSNIKHDGKVIGTISHDGMGEYTATHWNSKQSWASRNRKKLIAHVQQQHKNTTKTT